MKLSELKLEDLQQFLAIADAESLTVAAEHLKTNTSTLSRRLKKLENNLGTRLFDRTTRSLHITENGRLFYQHCQSTLDNLEKFSQKIHSSQEALEGRINIYAPAGLFIYLINDVVVKFAELHPELQLSFLSGSVKPHLLEDQIDIMIHIDEPADSSFIARIHSFSH